ncbi:GNAT family N-acetyltransferase [Glutamicibacter sp. NPDC087344]|uniref:GNAT family N-acetyltransferase n=1 Tax=Glutamicibacter sp. NPDC087344 TaxID=3363994 RepID=UPI0037F7E701
MFEYLTFALSRLSPNEAERAELASLYPAIDARWQQKMDRAKALVTVRDGQLLIAAGLVHDSIIAPTSAMDALELGSMAVRPDYRRMGIRERVASMRLKFALDTGGTPITIIDSANPASWAYYERSELWERERTFEQDGQTKFIYRATDAARAWAAENTGELVAAPQRALVAHPFGEDHETVSLQPSLEPAGQPHAPALLSLELGVELGQRPASMPMLQIGPEAPEADPQFPLLGTETAENDWLGSSVDPAF